MDWVQMEAQTALRLAHAERAVTAAVSQTKEAVMASCAEAMAEQHASEYETAIFCAFVLSELSN